MSRPKFRTSMTEFLLQPFYFENVKIKYTSTPLNADICDRFKMVTDSKIAMLVFVGNRLKPGKF